MCRLAVIPHWESNDILACHFTYTKLSYPKMANMGYNGTHYNIHTCQLLPQTYYCLPVIDLFVKQGSCDALLNCKNAHFELKQLEQSSLFHQTFIAVYHFWCDRWIYILTMIVVSHFYLLPPIIREINQFYSQNALISCVCYNLVFLCFCCIKIK